MQNAECRMKDKSDWVLAFHSAFYLLHSALLFDAGVGVSLVFSKDTATTP
jgi:hypothetical protein